MPVSILLPLLLAGPGSLHVNVDSPILKSEFIYENAQFPSCHASTIVETSDHKLVAAWFGGTAEGAPDVVVYVSRYEQGTWTPPALAADGITGDKRFACYNPVLFQPNHGPLLLFYKVGAGPRTWWGRMTTSKDSGKTWEEPHDLPAGVLGPIKDKPIQMGNEILCGSSTESEGWRVHFESTSDLGRTWKVGSAVNDGRLIGAIQPSILLLGGGRLRAIGRTRQHKVFAIDSLDNGRTWGMMRLLDVPNPNSGIDAVRLRDGRFLLVYNNTPSGRTPLNVAISSDAETWRPVVTLESEPGEYSYPAVIQADDGLVHITYTWRRKRIKHVVLDPSRISDQK